MSKQSERELTFVYKRDGFSIPIRAIYNGLTPIEKEAFLAHLEAAKREPCQRCGNSKLEETPKDLMPTVVGAMEFRREQYGWSQNRMAQELGWNGSHYSEFVNGKRNLPYNVACRAFSLGVPPVALLQKQPNLSPIKQEEQ